MLQSNVAKEISELTPALRNMCVAVPSTLPDMLKASFFLVSCDWTPKGLEYKSVLKNPLVRCTRS